MNITLFNSLTNKKEKFKPTRPHEVSMYHCGPTVYDRQHLGNLRSAVIWDILRRFFEFGGYKANQVVNLTDFGHLTSDQDEGEDKMAKGLKRENLPFTLESMKTLAQKYADIYVEDRNKLNCLPPTHLPFASEHIKESIELIKKLEEKNLTYKTSDGIYFDTSKIKNYIKFGNPEEKGESRIAKNPEKKSDRDFALWKFANIGNSTGLAKPNADQGASEKLTLPYVQYGEGASERVRNFISLRDKKSSDMISGSAEISNAEMRRIGQSYIGWQSPWGTGFPGWHIECSVMSKKYLGETFDIHTGGIEHKPIHHTNEMAQSESVSGKPMANFWMHNEHLILPDGKMAKSKGNSLTIKDVEDKKIDPLSLRLLFLQAHYRSPQIFSWDALLASGTALLKIRNFVTEANKNNSAPDTGYMSEFEKIIGNDLDTPKALALLWEVMKDESLDKSERIATILEFDKVFGLNLKNYKVPLLEIPQKVKELFTLREKARKEKDFKKADELRDLIKKEGFIVNDRDNSSSISSI